MSLAPHASSPDEQTTPDPSFRLVVPRDRCWLRFIGNQPLDAGRAYMVGSIEVRDRRRVRSAGLADAARPVVRALLGRLYEEVSRKADRHRSYRDKEDARVESP